MEAYNGLAPAHNPPYITGIRLFGKRMPGVPLVGLFETAFYQFAPEAMVRYAVPQTWHDLGMRRWGFHGASHKFIAERSRGTARPRGCRRTRAPTLRGRWPCPSRRAASRDLLSPRRAVQRHGHPQRRAIGTSMGMSPQSGLPQNNRVGDLDSAAVPFVMKTLGLSLAEAERQMTKEAACSASPASATTPRHPRRRSAGQRPTRNSRSTCSSNPRATGSAATPRDQRRRRPRVHRRHRREQSRPPRRDLRAASTSSASCSTPPKNAAHAGDRGRDLRRRFAHQDFGHPRQRRTRRRPRNRPLHLGAELARVSPLLFPTLNPNSQLPLIWPKPSVSSKPAVSPPSSPASTPCSSPPTSRSSAP
jgi:hypothetical protein